MRIFNPPRNPWPRSIWKANIVIVFVLVSLGIASISRLATLVFAAAGDLDPTFGVNGKVTTNFFEGAGVDAAFATAIQPDGKIVAGGSTQNPVTNSADFALARYNIDGTLDTTFGSGGKVATDFLGFDDSVLAIAIQPDNKIIAAGYAIDGFNFESAVARYLSNGSLDTTFGNGGKVTASSVNMATAGAVQADGKIVIAGWGTGPGADYDFIVLRYNSNGTLDNSFGNGGKVTIHIGNDFAQGMVIQPDGKIVVAGYDGNSVATSDFALARLNVDGSLDSTFGIGGKVTTHFAAGAEAFALALGSDGKIVAAGFAGNGGSGAQSFDFGVARYNADGTLDNSFGTGGTVVTDFAGLGDLAFAVAIQLDGKIVVAGMDGAPDNEQFALARYNADGSLDTAFGTGGKVTGPAGEAQAVVIQSDGKILVVGRAFIGSETGWDFVLLRYTVPADTPSGSDITVQSGNAALTFADVSVAGTTTVTLIDPATVGQVSGGFAVSSLLSYEIETTAAYTGPITVALVVPDPISEEDFNNLIILHNENGVLVDITAASPARNYATRTIYGTTNSLSPFYVVRKGQHISTLFDETKAYKGGSTIPIKLRLMNGNGTNISSASTVLTARGLILIGGNTSSVVVDSGNANPDDNFRYDSALGGYVFNLRTKGLASGTYVLSLYVGTERSFLYTVKFEVK